MEMLDTTEVMAIVVLLFGLIWRKFSCHGNVP